MTVLHLPNRNVQFLESALDTTYILSHVVGSDNKIVFDAGPEFTVVHSHWRVMWVVIGLAMILMHYLGIFYKLYIQFHCSDSIDQFYIIHVLTLSKSFVKSIEFDHVISCDGRGKMIGIGTFYRMIVPA